MPSNSGRRSFLGRMALGGLGLAAGAGTAAPAIARERREWRMVTAWPKGFPGVGVNADRIAALINTMSDGRLHVTVHGAGEIVPPLQVFDSVSDGTVEMGHDASFHHMNKRQDFALFTTIPFGLVGHEYAAWLMHGGGQELWDEAYGQFGVQAIPCCNTGTQMFGWFREPLKDANSFRGLKFRTPGLNAAIMTKLGATVVSLPVGEIFQSLQSGTIDACELVGPYNDLAIGIHQVAKNYYAPGVKEPSTIVHAVVNKGAMESLPSDLQAIVRAACMQGYIDSWAEYTMRSPEAMQVLVREHGVQLRRVPEDIIKAVGNAAGEVLTELRDDGDDLTRRIMKSYLGARQDIMAYTRIAEQGFLSARSMDYNYPTN